ncbi:MAG: hypothetical protein DLM72_19295 [Candidatus Nitrosopolaris wilkensis]|nr:MAG: hypothetical protein DLM72_19295 [Candidatus Nitrosopolaris wilkensis]
MGKHVIYFKGGLKSINATSGSNSNYTFAGPYGWDSFTTNVSLDNNKILTLPEISATRKDLRNTRTIQTRLSPALQLPSDLTKSKLKRVQSRLK